MQLVHATCVKTFERDDGKARLQIFKRNDGFYEFRGEVECVEDGQVYWGPAEMSGIYDTFESAERDAITSVPWLRQTSE